MTTRLLAWSDYCSPTGFANVMSNILMRLPADEFDIDVLGINYFGDPKYDHDRFPGRVFPPIIDIKPPYADQYGKQRLLDLAREHDYDTIFILQDTHVAMNVMHYLMKIRNTFHKDYKIVYYFPIDGNPWSNWIRDSVAMADFPVAYTNYAANLCYEYDEGLRDKLRIIPHGVDTNVFFPAHPDGMDYRAEKYPSSMDRLMLANINRNQPRKDILSSFMLLNELKYVRGVDEFCLYLHMSNQDIGGDLTPIARQLGLLENKDYFMPQKLTHNGVDPGEMNLIYNMSDVVITTSLGEGWGLSLTEAMATRTPVMAPDHTSIAEILDKGNEPGRGILVGAGEDSNSWMVIDGDNNILRPRTNVQDMAYWAIKLQEEENTDSFLEMIDNAFTWVVGELDWDIIVRDYWKELLAKEN